jgi:hypothetical protein
MRTFIFFLVVSICSGHIASAQQWSNITGTQDINNTNSGNVGIGTPPSEKLTIQGNLKFGGNATQLYNFYIRTYDGSALVNNGNGRNLIIIAGSSDNQMGKLGGNLYLRPGVPASPATAYGNVLLADEGGRVGIGTSIPDSKLTVKGTIHAEEVKVDLQVPGPDYVFEPSYKLPSLEELQTYIHQNKHLPEVPSAKEMEQNGIKLSEMNMILLRKIEELTLYVIEQNKIITQLREEQNVSRGISGKKVEELMLYMIELKTENEEIKQLRERIELLEK